MVYAPTLKHKQNEGIKMNKQYAVVTKSGKEISRSNTKMNAVLALHQFESQDIAAGVYEFGSYQIVEVD